MQLHENSGCMTDVSEAAEAAWVALVRAHRVATARVEADLKAAGLPPLAWYDALWELTRAPWPPGAPAPGPPRPLPPLR